MATKEMYTRTWRQALISARTFAHVFDRRYRVKACYYGWKVELIEE